MNPDDARAHNALGVALAGSRNLPEAKRELQAAVKLEPSNDIFQKNLRCIDAGCSLVP
jgi:Flp pilus assembly protein TadD